MAEHYEVTPKEVDEGVAMLGEKLLHDNWIPDQILFIPRGGHVPAIKLRDYLKDRINYYCNVLDIGTYTIYRKFRVRLPFRLQPDRKYLIVDDIYDTGNTYNKISKAIPENMNVKFAFLYIRDYEKLSYYVKQDLYYGLQCKDNRWLDFPWELERAS